MAEAKSGKTKDPIVHSSLSWQLTVASLFLVAFTALAAWDEGWRLRPWKTYQAEWVVRSGRVRRKRPDR